jgi:hypothetical protein
MNNLEEQDYRRRETKENNYHEDNAQYLIVWPMIEITLLFKKLNLKTF